MPPRRRHRGSPSAPCAVLKPWHFMRILGMPAAAESWSPTSLRDKLIKIGAKVVSHGRYASGECRFQHLSKLSYRGSEDDQS
jgi:hypothetical protein